MQKIQGKLNCVRLFIVFVLAMTATPAWTGDRAGADRNMFISVSTLERKIKAEPELMIVDVRSKKTFEQVRIPGSVNIPLFALKTKKMFRKNELVLVNEGFLLQELVVESENLIRSGFKVKLLEGGLTAWKARGKRLDGDPLQTETVNRVSISDFFMQNKALNVCVVDLSKSDDMFFQSRVQAKRLSYSDLSVMNVLRDFKKKSRSDLPVFLVVTDERGDNYEAISKQLEYSKTPPYFFLEGGREAYKAFIEDMHRMHATRTQRLMRSEGCPSCTERVAE